MSIVHAHASLTALERLTQLYSAMAEDDVPVRFADLETLIHEVVAGVEQDLVERGLARLDVDAPTVFVNGVAHRRILRSPRTLCTLAGDVQVERWLYRADEEGARCVAPMELRAGIVNGFFTPRAARVSVRAMAEMTPGQVEELFKELGGLTPSRSTLDRLAKEVGERWEDNLESYQETLCTQLEVPEAAVTMAVSLDGVLAPMRDGGRARKRQESAVKGKVASGPAGYKELGVGTISLYDADGKRLSTLTIGRMPEKRKVTLKDILREDVFSLLSLRPNLTVVKVADGARDNWTFLDELVPDGENVIDFFHAAEHVNRGLVAAYGTTDPVRERQFKRLRDKLRDEPNGVESVIRALRYLLTKHPRRKALKTELLYFRRNRHRMQYARLRARHLPIGSGVVEAACKTLVTQRMKRSGQRWRQAGGQAVLTWRGHNISGRFDQAWGLVEDAYTATVDVPDNLIQFVPRSAHAGTPV